MKPRLRVTSVTIAAAKPRELAQFYGRLLDLEVTTVEPSRPGYPQEDGWAQIRPPAGLGMPTLNFEWESGYVPPSWPSVPGEQQLQEHLDIAVDDLDAAVAWAQDAGATLADFQPQDGVRVLFDPDGHPFCLFASGH
ncbi:catechol 2,3-dioxygenase-like lactoylglutathione lyase family enzyme [Tamaricihabitans halophyticus]|uniref:Catechol 2,3-dioxygenase-like lactoylglutathione lyase family enzyme n=1 Tax=Tamaricihabitans halophyticus TaxID=1262583 RepID=A0A4R2QZB0_9PSEU|nr:VOC family protein [Tamaricihabitans halophyticus]TCP55017.1 catechol 2,3-dioxygenase-like lactoylglutathione lyase family enzyme [Tamaricihabitans halophyticus]